MLSEDMKSANIGNRVDTRFPSFLPVFGIDMLRADDIEKKGVARMARWGKRRWISISLPPRSKGWKARTFRSPVKLWPGGTVSRPAVFRAKPSKPIRKGGKKKFVIIFLVLFVLLSVQTFSYIEKNLRPPLMHVAKMRVKQVATQAINKAITERVAERTDLEQLIEWKTDGSGKVSGFMLNYAEHIRITSETVDTVQSALKAVHEVPERIPIGQAFDSAIIASFGPRVPVRFEPLGAAKVELKTRQQATGINMVLVEVYIRVMAEVSIIIPFDTEPELVESEIPVSYLLVVGDVPMYYYDNKGNPVGSSAANAPAISLPLEPGKTGVTVKPGAGEGERSGNEEAPAVPEPSHTEEDSGNAAP